MTWRDTPFRSRLGSVATLLAALLALGVHPLQPWAATRLDDTRSRLDSLAKEQSSQRERLGRLEGQEQAGLARLDQLEERGAARRRLRRQLEQELLLLETSQTLQQEELAALRVQLDSLGQRRTATGGERARVRSEAAALARRLFPLRRLDPLALLFQSASPPAAARSLRRLPWLGRGLERRLATLQALDAQLGQLQQAGDEASARGARHLANLERDGRRTRTARLEAQAELQRLEHEQTEQGRLLRSLRQDKELAAAQAERLRQAGQEVGRQVETLQRGWQERETRRESESRRQQAVSSRLGAAGAQDPPPAPTPTPKPTARSSASPPPARSAAEDVQAKSMTGKGLLAAKGRLPQPVSGRISRPFGARPDPTLGTVLDNPGVDYSCAPGAAVKSVHAGRVEKLTWVPGFGNTLLLSHGGDSWTVYAKLDEVQVREGQAVSAGQALGRAGRFDSAEQGALHFELWQGRQPQDPKLWLAR
ncbi:MAG: peptidoglycan DD-metalloendopeptidase family protein [Candidatus Delongbacteria bacterium]